MHTQPDVSATKQRLMLAIQEEGKKFQQAYLWLEQAMPEMFTARLKSQLQDQLGGYQDRLTRSYKVLLDKISANGK